MSVVGVGQVGGDFMWVVVGVLYDVLFYFGCIIIKECVFVKVVEEVIVIIFWVDCGDVLVGVLEVWGGIVFIICIFFLILYLDDIVVICVGVLVFECVQIVQE